MHRCGEVACWLSLLEWQCALLGGACLLAAFHGKAVPGGVGALLCVLVALLAERLARHYRHRRRVAYWQLEGRDG